MVNNRAIQTDNTHVRYLSKSKRRKSKASYRHKIIGDLIPWRLTQNVAAVVSLVRRATL